jgi:hypothetical protein
MLLLLEGSSDIGRALIAQRIVRAEKNWRHMAMEDLRELTVHYKMGVGDNDAAIVQLACHLANELRHDGIHLMISSPAAPHLATMLMEESAGESRSIHLGNAEEVENEPFDCVVDTTKISAAEACKIIGDLLRI